MDFHGVSYIYMILVILGVFAFLCDLGGPGHLKNINIPIGISTFSAWGRREPSESLKIDFYRNPAKITEI